MLGIRNKGFCALETLTASGVLGLLGVIVFQMISQLMMTYRILLCTEESKLIATQYVTCFQATGLCPENAIGTYADGTPYKIDAAYKLIACYLGANVNNKKDDKPRPRRVEYKGYNFYITSYSDEVLREVQLYAFESELEQCIGRARLLRNDCTVYVLSAFPCEQAELHSENYLS